MLSCNKAIFVGLLCVAALPGGAMAESAAETAVREALAARVGAGVRAVQETPLPGIYQALVGNDTVLTDASARYVIFGSLVDAETRRNLSAAFQEQHDRIDPTLLNRDDAIKIVRGTGETELHLFSDPDCPFCKRLEETLVDLGDVTIYTYLYPIRGAGSGAIATSAAIWCASDPQAAWAGYMLEGVSPDSPIAECEHPIRRNVDLGNQLAIAGTPTMFSSDGRRLAGAAPLEEIERFLRLRR